METKALKQSSGNRDTLSLLQRSDLKVMGRSGSRVQVGPGSGREGREGSSRVSYYLEGPSQMCEFFIWLKGKCSIVLPSIMLKLFCLFVFTDYLDVDNS